MGRAAGAREREYLAFAGELADAAREILRARFRSGVEVRVKPDGTPVTAADGEVEDELRRRIRAAWPQHGIVGEERGAEHADADLVWVLDPIDGTRAFLSGKPLFGTLIALLERGRPFLGVIESPITGERWAGLEGEGAFLNGERVAVRPARPLAEALLVTSTAGPERARLAEGFARLERSVRWALHDCDCYAYGMLARGDVDLVVEADLQPWDWCALVPVVRAAGGVATHWSGAAAGLPSGGDRSFVAAADAELARAAVRVLSGG